MWYKSDLTNEQFEIIDNIIPKSKSKPNIIPRIEIFNWIMYQLLGAPWG